MKNYLIEYYFIKADSFFTRDSSIRLGESSAAAQHKDQLVTLSKSRLSEMLQGAIDRDVIFAMC